MHKKGFTLLELLVVVLIIGILASIALPQYKVAVEKSRAAEAVTTLSSFSRGVEIYVMANGFSKVDLMGQVVSGFGDATESLDVEMSKSMDCTTDDYCHSKNFRYDASCTTSNCKIWAFRQENGDKTKPCLYLLQIVLTADGSGWKRYCNNYGTVIGTKICNSLQSQGFEIE